MTCDKSPETVGGGAATAGAPSAERKNYGFVDIMGVGARTVPVTKRVTLIGRERKCGIRLANEKVSREQCVLLAEDDNNGNCMMYLLNLTNRLTTIHEDRLLDPREKVRLHHNDRLRICGTELRFRLYGGVECPPPLIKSNSRDRLRKIVRAAEDSDAEVEAKKPQIDKSMLEVLKVIKAKTMLKRTVSMPNLVVEPAPVAIVTVEAKMTTTLTTVESAPLLPALSRKRGGSVPETDMRKAVLQRCFRRAFRERLNQVTKAAVDGVPVVAATTVEAQVVMSTTNTTTTSATLVRSASSRGLVQCA